MSYEQISFEDLATGNVAPDAPAEEPKKTKTSSKKKEETNVAEDKKGKGGLPETVCGYSRYEVVSAFHKELRKGDVKKATYWLQVMLSGGVGAWYIANYLWWIHAEELAMEEVHGDFGTYLAALNQHGSKADPYQLYYAVIRFCKAKKWWECEESTKMRLLWAKYAKILKENNEEEKLEIPYYAHDRHTAKGKALMKAGKADLRYSGTWMGMIWRRKAMEQFGRIDVPWEDVKWEDGELEFWQYMEDNIC